MAPKQGAPRKLVCPQAWLGSPKLVCAKVRSSNKPVTPVQVGAAFMSHNVALPDGKTLKFEIW